MSMFIKIYKFMQGLFDEEMTAHKAAEIGQAILAARSLRLTDIAAQMRGTSDASYKRISVLSNKWIHVKRYGACFEKKRSLSSAIRARDRTSTSVVSPAQADALIEEIQGMSIEIVDADWKLTYQAAIFKSKGGLSYADCYSAALGKLRQAEVVTDDPEFQKLKGEITTAWSVS
jgi:predicted nucleic acid-binding protein